MSEWPIVVTVPFDVGRTNPNRIGRRHWSVQRRQELAAKEAAD